jgi:Zn finger protein HypA/HybF involved in hydrogenase expression
MKNLFNGSRIGIEGTNRIYIQGDYTPWHNEDEDILEGQDCPLVYKNLDLISINQDGLWLEQKGTESLIEDTTWCLYETDCTNKKENYLDAEILKKELGIEEEKELEGKKVVLVCSNCGNRWVATIGNFDGCKACGSTLNLYPVDISVFVAPTYEIASKGNYSVTIEAEYGEKTVHGLCHTSAHHGINSNNPAPCNDENIPYLHEGCVLLSHIDLDSILGCMRVFGIQMSYRLISMCKIVEYIDVNGPHHLYQFDENAKLFFQAYWSWNESNERKERITELTDVTQQILESIEIIEKIISGNKELLENGYVWSKNIQEATEKCLKKETKYYRLFLTDRVFCGASYYSPQQNTIIPAIISYNEKFKAITLSFEDSGKKFKADEIMKELFGDGAGGKAGIAGTPRGKEFTFEDTQKVIDKINILMRKYQCSNCEAIFDPDEVGGCCPICANTDID